MNLAAEPRSSDGRKRGDGMNKDPERVCRICGFDFEDVATWEHGVPQYVICLCCGMESGLEDTDLEKVRNYRAEWVANGALWASPRHQRENSNVLAQMANIPAGWR
ncbi:hypothetical protein ACFVAM_13300 [Streptomyces californicus]|uniref:hypothetical protein n=1 Tax=Streptomyces californicus TaxID=67351 RepID=UPI00368B5C37